MLRKHFWECELEREILEADTGNMIAVASCGGLYMTGALIELTIFTIGSLTSIDCSAVLHPAAGTAPLNCTVML